MYSFNSRIRYSETDNNNRMKIHAMVNYLQDCSTFQSESIDRGIEWLKKVHHVWVLNAWQIEILDDSGLKLGSDIRIGTWMYDYKGSIGNRNFVIENPEGKRLVNANSIWVLMDTETMRPVRITDEDVQGYERENRIDMEYLGRKINVSNYARPAGEAFPVRYYHIDTNRHVNNANYFLMAEEFIPQDFAPHHLRAEYRKSAVLGDVIYPYIEEIEGGYTVSMCDENKKPYAIIEMIV